MCATRIWPCLSLVAGLGAFALTEILSFRAGIQPFYTVLGGIYAFVGVLAIAKSLQSLLESLARKPDSLSEGGADAQDAIRPPEARRRPALSAAEGHPSPAGRSSPWEEPGVLDRQAASQSRSSAAPMAHRAERRTAPRTLRDPRGPERAPRSRG